MNNQPTPATPDTIPPVKPLKWPLTPYQLFSPISSTFLNNLTQEEQILGLYKRFNEFVVKFNEILSIINPLAQEMENLSSLVHNLEGQLLTQFTELVERIEAGDLATLKSAKDYTDKKFNQIDVVRYGALTVSEYDSLELTAEQYDNYNMTAREYDTKAKWILFGEDGSVYVGYIAHKTVNSDDIIFDLSDPPLPMPTGRRYEIDFGAYLNGSPNNSTTHVFFLYAGDDVVMTLLLTDNGVCNRVFNLTEPLSKIVYINSNTASGAENELVLNNCYVKIKPYGEYNK